MRNNPLGGLSLKPWLLGTLIPVVLGGCQVSGGRFDSNQALAFGSIAVAIFLLVMLVVQRSRYMRLIEDEVKKTETKMREEADRRVEAARAEADKEHKKALEEARADVSAQIKDAREEARLEAVTLVRDTKTTAKHELEAKLNEVRDQALAEAERRIKDIEAKARQQVEQQVREVESRAREDLSRQQQRSREDAERRLQEARRRAARARSQQRPAPSSQRQAPPAPRPAPPAPQQHQAVPVSTDVPAAPAGSSTVPWSSGPSNLDLPGGGISILLAEDSATMRKVFEMTLAGENCKLVTAGSGDQALDLARKLKPDLVIADLSLGSPDGYDICQQLKGDAETAGAQVILLHGSASTLDERRAQECGAQAEITKPFTTAELLSKIQALF